MKKNLSLMLGTVLISAMFAGCSNDEQPVGSQVSKGMEVAPSQIRISIPTKATKANTSGLLLGWTEGDKVGLYPMNSDKTATYLGAVYNIPYAFYGQYEGVKRGWKYSAETGKAELMLNNEQAQVLGFTPYIPEANDPKVVPVTFNTNVDFMYGQNNGLLSNKNTVVDITLKHLQAYVSVVIKRSADKPYAAEGNISQCKLVTYTETGNADDPYKAVKDQYTLTGKVNIVSSPADITTITKGDMVFPDDVKQQIPSQAGNLTNASYVMIAPTSIEKKAFLLTVDNVDFVVPIHTASWDAGYKYAYTLTLTGKGFDLGDDVDPSNPNDHSKDAVKITKWEDGKGEDIDF